MNSLSMILRILAIIAALAAGALFYLGKGKLAEQQVSLEEAEQSTAAVQAELTTANEQISTLEGNLSTERSALADEKRKLESIRSEMYTAKQEVSRAQQQLAETKKTIQGLEGASNNLRSELLQSEQSLTAANREGEIAQLNERVAELEQANADLKESLDDANERATESTQTAAVATNNNGTLATGGSYSSTFNPTPSQPLPVATLGAKTTIQSLSAKNGLVVLSNSPELGLSPGTEVTVIRDLKALGKIQIVQVSNDLVVANILPGTKTRQMVEGATVNLLH